MHVGRATTWLLLQKQICSQYADCGAGSAGGPLHGGKPGNHWRLRQELPLCFRWAGVRGSSEHGDARNYGAAEALASTAMAA